MIFHIKITDKDNEFRAIADIIATNLIDAGVVAEDLYQVYCEYGKKHNCQFNCLECKNKDCPNKCKKNINKINKEGEK